MPVRTQSPELALSIRQPWATLVVLGLKTIEIRRWSTPIRGRIFIHAGKIADDRWQGWSRVPEEHFALTVRRGGIIGAIDIIDCLTYSSVREFTRDRQLHFNEPSWFVPPRIYGFRFEKPKIVPFRACPGQVKFFPVAALPPIIADDTSPTNIPDEPLGQVSGSAAKRKLVRFEIDAKPSVRTRRRSKK